MGSFSIWHWLIILILTVPIFFVLRSAPSGPNRFGEQPLTLNFGEAISSFFRNYVNFTSRASRSEFWYSFLFTFCISLVLTIVDRSETLSGVWGLAVLLPTIAVSARRLHDINRSGWNQLLGYLFPIGTIALIVWYCRQASDAGTAPTRSSLRPATLGNIEILEKLAKLKQSGALSEEEFEAEKRKILLK